MIRRMEMDGDDSSDPKQFKPDKLVDTEAALQQIKAEAACFGDNVDGSDMMKTLVDGVTGMSLKGEQKPNLQVAEVPVRLKLRKYQEELSRLVCCDSLPNTIVVSETNSGKTVIAVHAILNQLEKNLDENLKCVFITHRVALCEQQYKLICKYVHKDLVCICHGEVGPTQNIFMQGEEELEKKLRAKKVLVFTAQTLLNLLTKATLNIGQFKMVIFDECHHVDAKHPYNMIMMMYLIKKRDLLARPDPLARLPQIIGLSASPTVFEQKILDKQDANKCLSLLIDNMDISKISTVQKEKDDLEKHCKTPEEEIKLIHLSPQCPFTKALRQLMSAQLKFLQGASNEYRPSGDELRGELEAKLQNIPQLDSQDFEAWAIKLGKFDSKNPFLQVCLDFSSSMLRKLNGFLRISRSVDSAVILEEIQDFYQQSFVACGEGENVDKGIDRHYDAFKQIFTMWQPHLQNGADYNKRNGTQSMMNELRRILTQEMELGDSSGDAGGKQNRAIVFVQTKLEAELLTKWAKDDQLIADKLCPDFITADVKNQTQVLQSFEKQSCRLLFATSVIEEGIDIPDCKIVVDYHNFINHIQQLQRRGRARMKNGKYFFITCDEKYHKAALTNQARQRLTEAAIQDLISRLEASPLLAEQMKRDREARQMANVKAYLADLEKEKAGYRFEDHLFNFKCVACTKWLLDSNEVFCFKDNFRIFLTKDMDKKIRLRRITEDPDVKTQKFLDMMNVEEKQSVHCKKCKNKLGKLLKFGFFGLPNMTLDRFLVEHSLDCAAPACKASNGGTPLKIETKVYKKWKQVPFPQKSITGAEVKKFFGEMIDLGSESGIFHDIMDLSDELNNSTV